MTLSKVTLYVGLAALAAGLTLSTARAEGKAPKKVETVGKTARGGTDPNIRTPDLPANDPAKVDARKAEAKRGSCKVTVDSYRDLYIKIYVDGDFKGTLSPMGNDYTYALSGRTRLYARADFSDGSYVSWGPDYFLCEDGEAYTWTLR